MNNTELVNKVKNIEANYNNVYAYGVFGQTITESIINQKSKQYPSWYTSARITALKKLIGKGYFGFDCVNLIKAVLWGWDGKTTQGGAKYASNGVPDVNADTMFSKCIEASSNFSNIEKGEAVWISGHIGIYIGDGLAIECTPKWKNGVQITAVKNIGSPSGYNARSWTKHGKLPWIDYERNTDYKKGDIVSFKEGYHYLSANAKNPIGKARKPGSAKITAIKEGAAHPYHLIRVSGGGSNVYGWVNKSTFI